MKRIVFLSILILLCFSTCTIGDFDTASFTAPSGRVLVSFSVASDMRSYTGCNRDHFRGVCDAIDAGGKGAFMVSAGDVSPPMETFSIIQSHLGHDYTWYPVVGNHEAETSVYMRWLRAFNENGIALPNIVHAGPPGCEETTYSFEYGNAHFVVLNEYYDGASDRATNGDVHDALHDWLIQDLDANAKPVVLVFGHEPAYPQPDAYTGRLRHEDDSLNIHPQNRDRFWQTLNTYGVTAYVCGHTHNYSAVRVRSDGSIDPSGTTGVWQIDSGHARGTGDRSAPSTFVMFWVVEDGSVWFSAYRLDAGSDDYLLAENRQIR